MRITVIGASGGTGRQVVDQACAADHDVTAVVRDPAALPAVRTGLTVERADVMDPAALAPVLRGQDAVVSALGSRDPRRPTTVCTDGVRAVVAAMHAAGTRRLVVVSAAGLVTEGDGPVVRRVVKPVLGRVFRHVYADLRTMEDVVRASDLDWTIVRPPRLTDGPRTGGYRWAVERTVPGGFQVSRADVADCVLRSLRDGHWVRDAVAIAN